MSKPLPPSPNETLDITLESVTTARYPYPGLRPFREDEADIFFGRNAQIDQLLEKLEDHQFLAVVGPSGCGKSSLIRAGLLPALETGMMANAGFRWCTATMRPGNAPIANLVQALMEQKPEKKSVLEFSEEHRVENEVYTEQALRNGPKGLAEVIERSALSDEENLLLLVDQFEEIFRYADEDEGDADEARAFVDLLLESVSDQSNRIYVVITMRSDFLGKCPMYRGLPEAMNDSQYLTPRLTRSQIEEAIVGPAAMFDSTVDGTVVTRILNAMGTDPDQLPLMQHLLMRMWQKAKHQRLNLKDFESTDSVGRFDEGNRELHLTLQHYKSVGGLAKALSNHVDNVFLKRLKNDEQRAMATMAFRLLTTTTPEGQEIRRPTSFGNILSTINTTHEFTATNDDLRNVLAHFRQDGRSFVMPPPGLILQDSTPIDISHESLIRQWGRLKKWTRDEAHVRKVEAMVLADTASWKEAPDDEDRLLSGVRLEQALGLQEELSKRHRSRKAQRFDGHELDIVGFLEASRKNRDAKVEILATRKLWKNLATFFSVLALAMLGLVFLAWSGYQAKTAADFENKRLLSRRTLRTAMDLHLLEQRNLGSALAMSLKAMGKDQVLARESNEESFAHRARVHRVRLATGLRQIPIVTDLLSHEWARQAEYNFDGQFVFTAGAGGDDVLEDTYRVKVWKCGGRGSEPFRELKHVFDKIAYEVSDVSWCDSTNLIVTTSFRSNKNNEQDDKHYGRVDLWKFSTNSFSTNSTEADVGNLTLYDGVTKPKSMQVAFVEPHLMRVAAAFNASDRNGPRQSEIRIWNVKLNEDRTGWTTHERQPEIKMAGDVATVRFSGDGRYVVVSLMQEDKTGAALVYNSDAEQRLGRAILPPLRHEKKILLARFDATGKYLVTAGADHVAKVWDSRTGEMLSELKHDGPVLFAEFSPDPSSGLIATTAEDNTARIWDWSSDQLLHTLPHDHYVFKAEFSPDGRHLLTSSRDQNVRIWDVEMGAVLYTCPHNGSVSRASFGPDGQCFVSESRHNVRLWRLPFSKAPFYNAQNIEGPPLWSDDGAHLVFVRRVSESDSSKAEFNIERKRVVSESRKDTDPITLDSVPQCMALSPDGSWLLFQIPDVNNRETPAVNPQSELFGFTSTLSHCDGELVQLQGESAERKFHFAAFSADNKIAATIGPKSEQAAVVSIWNVESGELFGETQIPIRFSKLASSYVSIRRMSGDSNENYKLLVSLTAENADHNVLHTFDVVRAAMGRYEIEDRGELQAAFDQGTTNFAVYGSQRGQMLTLDLGRDDKARLWDVDQPGKPETILNEDTNLNPATAAKRQDAEKKATRSHESDIVHACFNSIETKIVTSGLDSKAKIWSERRGRWIAQTLAHDSRVNWAAFSNYDDLNLVATASQDQTARVWDAGTGELVAVLPHMGDVVFVCFLPEQDEQRRLRTISYDNRGQVIQVHDWDLDISGVLNSSPDQLKDAFEFVSSRIIDVAGEGTPDNERGTDDDQILKKVTGNVQDLFAPYCELVAALKIDAQHGTEHHAHLAQECESKQQWFAAAWHRQAVEDTPGASRINRIDIARALAKNQQLREALVVYRNVVVASEANVNNLDIGNVEISNGEARDDQAKRRRIDLAELLVERAAIHDRLGECDLAFDDYKKAISLAKDLPFRDEDDRRRHNKEVAAWHRDCSRVALRNHDWKIAKEHCESAIKLDDGNWRWLEQTALCLLEEAKSKTDVAERARLYKEAAGFYGTAIQNEKLEVGAEKARILTRWAETCGLLGQWKLAADKYGQAIEIIPGERELRLKRGHAYAHASRWTDAINDFEDVARRWDSDYRAFYYLSMIQLAKNPNGPTDEEIREFEQISRDLFERFSNTQNASVANDIAWACLLRPRTDTLKTTQLVQLAEKAVRLDPASLSQRNTLGLAYYRIQRHDQSRRIIQGLTAARKAEHELFTDVLNTQSAPTRWQFLSNEGTVWDWILLSMLHHTDGETDQAQRWLRRAQEWNATVQPATTENGSTVQIPWFRELQIKTLLNEASSKISSAS